MTLESLLASALSGLVEAIAAKTLDLGIEGVRKAAQFAGMVEKYTESDLQRMVQDAVEEVRKAFYEEYRSRAEAQRAGSEQYMTRWLKDPSLSQAVSRQLLFGGELDFAQLQRHYIDEVKNPGESWQQLTPHLQAFFRRIETRLLNDVDLGPLLLATRALSAHLDTAAQTQIIMAATLQMQAAMQETAENTARIARATEQIAAVVGADHMGVYLEYLRSLFGKAWANVRLADISQHQEQAKLLDLYVPLKVDCTVMVRVQEHHITDWWIARDEERAAGARSAESVELPKERSWQDLRVDEAAMQQIVDGIQRKIEGRRAQGKETEDGEHRWYMEAHDAASVQPAFVLLGAPGSGKSSFLHHMVLCQAGELRRRMGDGDVPANASLAALKDWLLPDPHVPIFIELRDLVRQSFPALPDDPNQNARLPTVEDFWDYVRTQILGAGLSGLEHSLRRLCREGKALLLLDGLDEVPQAADARRRDQIKALIDALRSTHPRLRMVITGRPNAYRRGEWSLTGFGRAELQPLDGQRLHELARSLFKAVLPHDAEAEAQDFVTAIRNDRHIDHTLYATPLFFTLLAAIWLDPARTGQLPGSKTELYRQAVDLLLVRWTRNRASGAAVFETLGIANPAELRPLMETLACTVTEQSLPGQDTTVFPIGTLAIILAEARIRLHSWEVSDYLAEHAGILVASAPNEFHFVHKSFQEHLAASELVCADPNARIPPVPAERRFADGLVRRIQSRPDLWENVARLAAEDLVVQRRTHDLWQVLVAVCQPYLERNDAAQAAILALEIVDSLRLFAQPPGRYDPNSHSFELLRQVAELALTDIPRLVPAQRAVAGRVLGAHSRLDTRPGVGLRGDGLPDIDWVKIPERDAEGRDVFLYGEDNEARSEPTFWMARYPVTYVQFQAFVDAEDGLRNPQWWDGLARKDNDDLLEQRFSFWNHPRESVSWYQATAFCRWLSARAGQEPTLLPEAARNGPWRVALPSEWQWEKAARGHDGRTYPWGPEYISGYANVDETEGGAGSHYLRQTSAVGLYPQGATPGGIHDLSGNVWEWCRNEYGAPETFRDEGDEDRVVRGGSSFGRTEHAKASSRYGDLPWLRLNFYGFRCVVVPLSHGKAVDS